MNFEDCPEYSSWRSMLFRCSNPNARNYDRYGGKGIKVCPEWVSFKTFLKDMGPKPSPKHSLDRKDNTGNYEPSNCCWATWSEQNHNRGMQSNNTSGTKGVSYHKPYEKWVAYIYTDRKRIHIGYFKNKEEAIEARKSVEIMRVLCTILGQGFPE